MQLARTIPTTCQHHVNAMPSLLFRSVILAKLPLRSIRTSVIKIVTLKGAHLIWLGVQCLSGRVLDSIPKGRGAEPHRRHCVVSLSKNINPSLVLVQPRKTRPFITERLLIGRKESNQTKPNVVKVIFHTLRNCSESKEFAPSGSKFFPLREVPIWKGT